MLALEGADPSGKGDEPDAEHEQPLTVTVLERIAGIRKRSGG